MMENKPPDPGKYLIRFGSQIHVIENADSSDMASEPENESKDEERWFLEGYKHSQ